MSSSNNFFWEGKRSIRSQQAWDTWWQMRDLSQALRLKCETGN